MQARNELQISNLESDDVPICGAEYPLVAEGIRELRCIDARIYRHPGLPDRPWKCQLEFAAGFGECPNLFGFLHLGTKEKPDAGRARRYWRCWCLANQGPPKKRQKMSPRVFKNKWFVVQIETVRQKRKGKIVEQLPEHLWYSVIREIVDLRH